MPRHPRGMILDQGYSWVIFAACFANIFISLGIPFSMGVYNVEYLDYFQESKSATGWILSINIGLLLGAGPVAAWLMSRFSERTVACCGSVLCTIGTVSMYFCQSIYQLYVTYGLITGFGYCLVYIPSAVLVGHYFKKYRTATTAVCSAGAGLAMLILPFFYNAIIERYTWRGSVFILAGINLQTLVFSVLLRPQNKPVLDLGVEQVKTKLVETSCKTSVEYQDSSETDKFPQEAEENRGRSIEISLKNKKIRNSDLPNDTNKSINCVTEKSTDCTENDQILRDLSKEDTSNSVIIINSSENTTKYVSNEISDSNKNCMIGSSSLGCQEKLLGSTNIATCKSDDMTTEEKGFKEINRHYYEETKGHVMKDFNFVVYFISNIFWNIGTGMIVIIPVDYLYENGIDKGTANLVVVFGGIGSTTGGTVAGIIGNYPRCNRLLLYIFVNIAAGITGFLYIASANFTLVSIIHAFFGGAMGGIVGLLVVLCADIVGMTKLGQAYGYLMLSNGVGNLVALPLAGLLFDLFGNYKSSFALAAVLNILGGAVMILIIIHKRKIRSKHQSLSDDGRSPNTLG